MTSRRRDRSYEPVSVSHHLISELAVTKSHNVPLIGRERLANKLLRRSGEWSRGDGSPYQAMKFCESCDNSHRDADA